ncbi:MAG: AI-2E family transporter [Actinomycetota bacterium]
MSDHDLERGAGEHGERAGAPAPLARADAPPTAPDHEGAVVIQRRPSAPMPAWVPRVILLAIVSVLAAIAFVNILGRVRQLLIWLLISLFLSFALEPAVNWLHRRGWKRGLATALVLLVLLLLGVALIASMVPLVISQTQGLIGKVPGWLHDLSSRSHKIFGITISTQNLSKSLEKVKANLANYAKDIAANLLHIAATVVGLLFQLLTIALFTFYMVADGPRFRRTVCSVLSPERQRRVLDTWEVAIDKTGGYLYSRLLLALLSGVSTFIVLTLLGVPFAVALALWMGLVSQFIPVVGTYIAMLLPVLVALAKSPGVGLAVLIYFAIYQQIENYLLSPKITARTMQLHPAVAFASAIVGGSLLGPIGAFLALPAAAIIQAVLSSYLERYQVVETDLTEEAPVEPPRHKRDKGLAVRIARRLRARRRSREPAGAGASGSESP